MAIIMHSCSRHRSAIGCRSNSWASCYNDVGQTTRETERKEVSYRRGPSKSRSWSGTACSQSWVTKNIHCWCHAEAYRTGMWALSAERGWLSSRRLLIVDSFVSSTTRRCWHRAATSDVTGLFIVICGVGESGSSCEEGSLVGGVVLGNVWSVHEQRQRTRTCNSARAGCTPNVVLRWPPLS